MVIDADFGYTRQVAGAQSLVDIAAGDFGLVTMGIPGTNGPGINYVGQPSLMFGPQGANNFSSLGNSNGANPFLFRDNQFTADVNLSWTKGRHATKYGFTWYHFDLNHFQPTSGSDINAPRGGFRFKGGMTINSGAANAYNSLADFLLGLPNNDTGAAVAKPFQLSNPNALRWSQYAVYAQDQWSMTPKLTLNYGVRYELYPAPYRDHTGVYRMDPTLPQSANVEIGGVNGNPQNAGIDMGWGMFTPRLGIAYRINDRLVIRAGAGATTDPDSLRFLRDSFPIDLAGSYSGLSNNSIAVDASGNPLPLSVGIPILPTPNLSTGFASLPSGSGTNTVAANYRRGYIESWNLFVEQDLGNKFVLNVGYVGTHQVRQLGGYTLNSAPLSSGATICMANGQFNPSSPYFKNALGSNPCNPAANEAINFGAPCPTGTSAQNQGSCYNTGGITMNRPIWSSNYNGLQSQLTRNAGRLAQFGLVYTWSHAFDYQDNGAGSGSAANSFSFPDYFKFNRATAGYDRTNNLQFWGIYHLPFGAGQSYLNHGIASAIFGGFQLNGQISHVSGTPFSVTPSSSTGFNAPGNTLYADLVKPYRQIGGHSRTSCVANSGCSSAGGGTPWFDPTSFANPIQPTYTANQLPGTIVAPHFGNTHRNQFRGPGVTSVNASIFRGFHIYRESEFQIRVEAFNLLNHAILGQVSGNNPVVNSAITPAGGNFGYITTFGASRTLQFSGRFNF
jgi:hypothetical protein